MLNEMQKRDMLRLSNEEAQKLSRECLETALLKLMGQKDYERISIAEIVELAGVSRNAFYRNYKTKEALLESLSDTIAEKLKDALPQERTDTDAYACFFRTVLEDPEIFRILLSVRTSLAERLMSKETSYARIAWEGAFAQIIIHWYMTGMKETPEEMGHMCSRLLSRLPFEDSADGCTC